MLILQKCLLKIKYCFCLNLYQTNYFRCFHWNFFSFFFWLLYILTSGLYHTHLQLQTFTVTHAHTLTRTVKNLQQDVQACLNKLRHVQTYSKMDFFRCKWWLGNKTPWPSIACCLPSTTLGRPRWFSNGHARTYWKMMKNKIFQSLCNWLFFQNNESNTVSTQNFFTNSTKKNWFSTFFLLKQIFNSWKVSWFIHIFCVGFFTLCYRNQVPDSKTPFTVFWKSLKGCVNFCASHSGVLIELVVIASIGKHFTLLLLLFLMKRHLVR